MPTLEWIGKDKVVNHHREVPSRVLEERYTYDVESENLIVHGDKPAGAQSSAAPVRGPGEVYLHRPAVQYGQRGLGVQRQRK